MKERFEGEDGRERLEQALLSQRFCSHNVEVVQSLISVGQLIDIPKGKALVQQGAIDSDFYYVLVGGFDVEVNGTVVAYRRPGEHVGEVAAYDPSRKRTATVRAAEDSIVLKVDDKTVREIGEQYPAVLKASLVEANRRLEERNELVGACNNRPHILILSSKEAQPVSREIQSKFRDDDYHVRLWEQGLFELSGYPIPSLERALNESDFAVIVAQGDDVAHMRKSAKRIPRDNVTFEMGLSMGKLGLDRTIIVRPSDQDVHLATDTQGLTTARYRSKEASETALGPACNDIRKHITNLGVRRGRTLSLANR